MALTLELFPYQRDAFELFGKRGNLLLAFEMGLRPQQRVIAAQSVGYPQLAVTPR